MTCGSFASYKADVRETLTKTQTLRIAILRLDTDFYDSTLVELETLYPRLAPGGGADRRRFRPLARRQKSG